MNRADPVEMLTGIGGPAWDIKPEARHWKVGKQRAKAGQKNNGRLKQLSRPLRWRTDEKILVSLIYYSKLHANS